MLIHEEYFKNIFNTVREAILVLDENMRVLSANQNHYQPAGRSPLEVLEGEESGKQLNKPRRMS